MKLPAGKIESAVSKEVSRYMLRAVQLDIEEKCLIATDGHILAMVPVEIGRAKCEACEGTKAIAGETCKVCEGTGEGAVTDVTGLIGTDAIAEARKLAKEKRNRTSWAKGVEIVANDKVKVSDGVSTAEFERPEGTFPNWRAVMPEKPFTCRTCGGVKAETDAVEDLCKTCSGTGQLAPTISFDARLLLRLTEALGEKSNDEGAFWVSLWIKDGTSAIVVKRRVGDEAVGLIMPVKA